MRFAKVDATTAQMERDAEHGGIRRGLIDGFTFAT